MNCFKLSMCRRARGPRTSSLLQLSGFLTALVFSISTGFGQTPAFPGALGFGANATGGRDGTVYRVTQLGNSGPGSFRDAVSQPHRIVIFDVGGYVTLSSEVAMQSDLTIAGQSAPGGGIGIMGAEVSSGSSTNIIIRHVRFRPGSGADSGAHCLNLRGTNIIADHVSLEFGPWNNVGAVNANGVTIQNSFIADPIGQQFGAHTERLNGTFSWFYNVFANAHGRQPLAKINCVYINNVVYNYQAAYDCGDTSGVFNHDVVSNYFITGPATTSAGNDFYQMNGNQSFYSSGNLRDSNRDGVLNGSDTVPESVILLGSPWSPITPAIPTYSTLAAYRVAVSAAGAFPRDSVDNVIMNEVRTVGVSGPYPLPNSQTITGLPNNGFGNLTGGAISLDTDQDGMPDYWEVATGSNIGLNDSMTIGADGYALIERYVNWTAEPHAITTTNVPVDVELWQYTSGFTNVSPVYTVDDATNGVVTLLGNGHTAEFTPTNEVSSLGSFRFLVVGSDGTAYSNTVGVAISTQTQPSDLIWAGDGAANVWETAGDTNFLKNSVPVAFSAGDNVTFDDTGSSTPDISVPSAVVVGDMFVSAGQDYTFGGSGAIASSGFLSKSGAGALKINVSSSFIGGATIDEGIVQLGDGVSANGSLNANIFNGTAIIFANPTDVTNSASISGTGTLTKNGDGSLTLSGNQSYTGPTTINAGTLEFVGTPPTGNIVNNTAVIFRPPGATTYAGIISGPGRVQTSASSITTTLSGANTFSGGINITSGNLQLAHSRAAGTGPVTNSSSGLLYVGNGTVITNDYVLMTSTTDLSMRCDSGTGVWSGNVLPVGGGVSWRPGSDGGTLIFTGNAIQGTRNFIVPRGTFHAASNAFISASGTATALGRDTTDGNRSARITIRDNAVMDFGLCSMGGSRQGGYVVVTVQDDATLSTGANSFDLHNVNRSTAHTTLNLNGGTVTVGGFTKTRTGAAQLSTNNFNGGTLRAGAPNASFLPALTGLTANVRAGGAKIDDNGFAITISQPLIHDPLLGATLDGGLTKLGGGTLTLDGVNTYNGSTTVSNGTLMLSASSSIADTTEINVVAGATFDASAKSGFTLGNGCRLLGNGTIVGNLTLGSGSTLTPGTSVGSLTFNNDLVLSAGSTNFFEISKSPTTNDAVKVLGTASLGGAMIVTNIAGDLAAGDSFKLIDASAGYSGSFNSVALPPLDGGLAWNTNGLATNGVISVVALVPPVVDSITRLGGGGFRLTFSGPEGQAYEVRATTNLDLSPVTLWDLLETGTFGVSAVIYDDLEATNFASRFYLIRIP